MNLQRSLIFTSALVFTSAFAAEPEKKAAAPTDPEIAHIAVTANQVDIDAGKDAIAKSSNPKVKEFAQRMIDDHTAVIKQAVDLVTKLKVTPADNATSQSLKAGGEKARAEIGKKTGADFDKAYVDNEVAYHEAVIKAVDTALIPNAKNKELKDLLTAVKPALVAHLDHAKKLKAELAGGKAMTHEHGAHK